MDFNRNHFKSWLSLLFLTVFFQFVSCQISVPTDTTTANHPKNSKFNYKQLIIPSVLIGYGFIGLESDNLKDLNTDISNEVMEDIDENLTIDDFLMFVPAVSVYALNNLGIQGKNNLRDRSVILGTSLLFVFTS